MNNSDEINSKSIQDYLTQPNKLIPSPATSHTNLLSTYNACNYFGSPMNYNQGSQNTFTPYQTRRPLPSRSKLSTTLWEDEGTVCYQVDALGICVARRQDNDMINGTKLLNVAGMSRGKRDGILKNEKGRVVIKVGAMHLKGVWITFDRAKFLAAQYKIYDMLYPLFVDDPTLFLYSSLHHSMNIYNHYRPWIRPVETNKIPCNTTFDSENNEINLSQLNYKDLGQYNSDYFQKPLKDIPSYDDLLLNDIKQGPSAVTDQSASAFSQSNEEEYDYSSLLDSAQKSTIRPNQRTNLRHHPYMEPTKFQSLYNDKKTKNTSMDFDKTQW